MWTNTHQADYATSPGLHLETWYGVFEPEPSLVPAWLSSSASWRRPEAAVHQQDGEEEAWQAQ